MILITANSLAGVIFSNYLIGHNVRVEKIYIVSDIRGTTIKKIMRGMDLLNKKSKLFLFYRFFVEKILFNILQVNGRDLLSVNQIAKQYNVPVEKIDDVNSPAFISKFERYKKSNNIVLSAYGSQIFSKDLIQNIKHLWNVHGSYLPYFHGTAPYFWMLFKNGYPKGVTLHYVEPEVDAGKIIHQIIVEPQHNDSLYIYHLRCVIEAAKMVTKILNNESLEGFNKAKPGQPEIPYDKIKKHGLPRTIDMKDFKIAGKKLFRWKDIKAVFDLLKGVKYS